MDMERVHLETEFNVAINRLRDRLSNDSLENATEFLKEVNSGEVERDIFFMPKQGDSAQAYSYRGER